MYSKNKTAFPTIHVKALTAAEIHFLSTEYNLSYEEIIDMMISHGIDSMPGGGAEILMKMLEKEYVEEKLLQSNG